MVIFYYLKWKKNKTSSWYLKKSLVRFSMLNFLSIMAFETLFAKNQPNINDLENHAHNMKLEKTANTTKVSRVRRLWKLRFLNVVRSFCRIASFFLFEVYQNNLAILFWNEFKWFLSCKDLQNFEFIKILSQKWTKNSSMTSCSSVTWIEKFKWFYAQFSVEWNQLWGKQFLLQSHHLNKH